MSYLSEYRRFCESELADPDLTRELHQIAGDEAEIAARFSGELSFGTAGLRGIIGAGSARMNIYTVSRATLGLFDVVSASAQEPVFVIGHDTRNKSDVFARRAAEVLAGRGAKVYLAAVPIPVALVSYAVRALQAHAGICITASHNPAKYNGYKVFDRTGSQLLEEEAAAVSLAASRHDYLEPLGKEGGEILPIPEEVFETYFSALSKRVPPEERSLSVVYTPLCGTGLHFVPRALKNAGFDTVHLVEEQARHDGNFPTCEKPNPEERKALGLALSLAKKTQADVLLATDPDCDRVGVGVRDGEDYRLLTGNETGLLLMDYLLQKRREAGTLSEDLLVCTTIVSAEMADAVAADYGVRLCRVLTGFKYIGEQIGLLEKEGKLSSFLYGFEESYGCLASTDVRDKDACEACVLICTMLSDYKKQGVTPVQKLSELEARYGVYVNDLKNYEFTGPDAPTRGAALMKELRAKPLKALAGQAVAQTCDYLARVCRTEDGEEAISLPASDVLSFATDGGAKLIIRPSGTEPKIKAYLFAHAATRKEAEEILQKLREESDRLFG